MHALISPGKELRAALRAVVFLLIVSMICPPAFAQTSGSDEVGEVSGPSEVVQTQGSLGEALEGPIDPATYVLGPSDQLLVILKGGETSMHYLRVFPEGNVVLPNHGAFQAAGLTLERFTERVRELLQMYYRNMEIDVQLSVPRRFLIYVFGEVGTPGPVSINAMTRVSAAVEQAGGVKGSRRLIEIREGGETIRTVDLFMFLQTGDFDQNPTLKEGQTIFVPMKEITVNVIGEARRTGGYEMVEGETAADLLKYAGGIGPFGISDVILRERIVNAKAEPVYSFSIDDADTVDVANMDVFVVDDIRSYHGYIPVQVAGGGGRTGIFQVQEPEPLGDFLLRLWRIEPTAFDIEKAVLERPRGDGTSEQVVFNVREVLAGRGHGDMMVRPGDYVMIPPAITSVYVSGEVVAQGPVAFQPGLTAEKYVTLAGGPNDRGSIGKIKIVSLDGVERDADRDSVVNRGDTIVIGTKTSKIFGALWVGVISLTSLVVALVALSNSTK
jgi:protein involved in polysaccharide export with SLBB domain